MHPQTAQVLVIDGDGNLRTLIKLVLEYRGLRVLLAADGEAGLRAAIAQRPDLIVLDAATTCHDGVDAYSALASHPHTDSIPVLLCASVPTAAQEYAWGRLPQVIDLVSKPYDLNALADRVASALDAATIA